MERQSDEALLARAGEDEAAFAVFYRRYERPVLAFFVRAVGRGEVAADLTAEVFAQVILSVDRFDPEIGSASAWLFGIARNTLARARARGRVEDRARRRLGLPVLALGDETIERIEASAADGRALELLDALPEAQRVAVRARVVDELDYEQIARDLHCSALVVRKRVSSGLTSLRAMLKEGR
ncbi:MAG: RNA polymerase sigma factor [Solirubrobacteraceae bacterium]